MEWISKLVTPRGSEGDGEAAPAPATDDDRLSPTPHIRGSVTARAHKPPAGLPPGLPPAAADGDDDLSSDPDDDRRRPATGFKLNFNTLKRDAVDASKPVALKHTPREEVAAKAAAAAAGGDSDDLSSDPEDEVPAAKPTGFKLNFGGVKRDEVDASKPVALKHTPREDVVAKLGAGDDDDLSSDPEDETPAPKPTGFSLKLGAVKRDEVDASKPVAQSHTPREEVAAKAKLNLAAAAGSARGPASVVQQRTAAVAAKAQTAAPLRQLSTVPVDTTGDGKVDSLAIDTNHDGARPPPLPRAAHEDPRARSRRLTLLPHLTTGRVDTIIPLYGAVDQPLPSGRKKQAGTPRQTPRVDLREALGALPPLSTLPELPLDSPQYPKARRARPPAPPPSPAPLLTALAPPTPLPPSLSLPPSRPPGRRRCG